MVIYPAVKRLTIEKDTSHVWKKGYRCQGHPFSSDVLKRFSFIIDDHAIVQQTIIDFIKNVSLGQEAYQLTIEMDRITIHYQTEKGAFYALITLEQLMHNPEYKEKIPCLWIDDEPELSVRGFMLDISRNKIPEVATIKRFIDHMSLLKYNHLELYVEGMSYYYPSFGHTYDDDQTPMTHEEFLECQHYATLQMIDLVPCHNGLGHMTEWLTKFPELAELPQGMYMWGANRPASTLNPLSDESFQFVKALYQDAIKGSTSSYFHMNLDEPYELGHGKSQKEADEIGIGQVYLNYLLKLHQMMTSWGKTPLVWGDVLNHYPETLEQLPKDLIFVDWGYDYDYPFYETLRRLSEKNVRFMASPGTSSWNSVSGRTDDMLHNIQEACKWTKVFHGLGILLTDWGDNGHWQSLIISYPAMVYAGLESWRGHDQNRHLIKSVINRIFDDQSQTLGQLLLDLGTYDRYQKTYLSNRTSLMDVMLLKRFKDQHDFPKAIKEALANHPFGERTVFDQLMLWMEDKSKRITRIHLSDEQSWVTDQLALTIHLLDIAFNFIVLCHHELDQAKKTLIKDRLMHEFPTFLEDYQKIWLASNKKGGLKASMNSLEFMNRVLISII